MNKVFTKKPEEEGVELKKLLGLKTKSCNFDDVSLLGARRDYSRAETKADISGQFSRNLYLYLPVVSSPMTDVTDPHVAIVMAQNGGLGVLPTTYTPQEQAAGIRKVKESEGTFINEPFTLGPDTTMAEVLRARYSNIPIVDNGEVVGVYIRPYVPHDNKIGPEVFYAGSMDRPVREFMRTDILQYAVSPEEVMVQGRLSFERAAQIIRDRIIHVLLVLGKNKELVRLVTMKDVLSKQVLYPHATRDKENRLCVGAAILEDMSEANMLRIRLLAEEEVDVLVITQAQAENVDTARMTKFLKKEYPHIDVCPGNDSVGRAVHFHYENGADGVVVGQGPGSICISGEVVGLWRPQFSTAYACGKAAAECGIPCTVDGGIAHAEHAFKALIAGGTALMLGRVIAETKDSPAKEEVPGTKRYRGMGSPELVKTHATAFHKYDPKTFIPEGKPIDLPITGSLEEVLIHFKANLERCFERFGILNLEDAHTKLRQGKIRAQYAHDTKTR